MSEWVNLQTLIQSIFHPISSASLAEANAQLLSFAESKAAWYVCFELMGISDDINIRFFVINLIYNKIRRQWSQLESSERPQPILHLQEILSSSCTSSERAFVSRVILCLSCCYALSPDGIQSNIALAIDFIHFNDVLRKRTGLEMLVAVYDESEDLDVSRAGRLDIKAQLAEMAGRVFDCLNSMSAVNFFGDVQIQLYFIKASRVWCNIRGLTITSFISEYSLIWGGVYQSLASSDSSLVIESCHLLRERILIQEFPSTPLRVNALETLTTSILSESVISSLFGFFKDENQSDVMLQVSNMLTTLVENEIGYYSGVGFNIDLFHALLHCLSARPRKVGAITFDLWLRVQDIALANRNPYLREQVFYEILERLV